MNHPDDEETYKAKIEDLKSVAYIPEFYIEPEDADPTDPIAVRYAPRFWNAQLMFSFAQDPNCPNADYFRGSLFAWVTTTYRNYRKILTLDKNDRIVLKSGSRFEDAFEKPQPAPRVDHPEAQKILDRHFEEKNARHLKHFEMWVSNLENEIASLNETLDRFANSSDKLFLNDYSDLVIELKKANS
jgi:hypothetical protein